MSKLILFDFDGTIVDTIPYIRKIVEEVSVDHGVNIEFPLLRKMPTKDYVESLHVPLGKMPFILLDLKKRLTENYDIKPFPGMLELLNELSKRHQVGIVSGNSKKRIEEFCIEKKLDFIKDIEEDSSLFGKDHHINLIMKRREVTPDETIYVGDEERDIQAAKNSGVRCVAVAWGLKSKGLLKKYQPDYVVDSPADLKKLLKSM